MFWIISLIVSISCIAITGRTLVSYSDYPLWIKILVWTLTSVAWFSPVLVWNLQAKNIMPLWLYTFLAKCLYFLFGFAFILVMLLLARDVVWFVAHLINKNIISPSDVVALHYANISTLLITLLLSLYAVYSAEKMPGIKTYEYADSRVKEPLKILAISDMHITKMVSADKVKKSVEYFNSQNADIILFMGDIGDDKVEDVKEQISELKNLKAKYGIYYVIGNHETYFNGYLWEAEFASLGWQVLHNSGVEAENTGVYISGIPDTHYFKADIKQSLRQADDNMYRIMLTHAPALVNSIGEEKVDIVVAGHTHGGQIFPFNFLTSYGNSGYVSGEYSIGSTKLLVSRGAGYWGPQMRLFAPNDILLIKLNPKD